MMNIKQLRYVSALLILSAILLASLIPGGPIENRDFSHIHTGVSAGFNIFLTVLNLGTFALTIAVIKQRSWAYTAVFFAALSYFTVFLITSGFSVSATEVFTVLMRSLPQVTHIGEPTNGALSDVLEKELPNGWEFTLSNEVYRDTNAQAFEAVGIPPAVSVPVLSKEARDRGEDSALNSAFDVLSLPNAVSQ